MFFKVVFKKHLSNKKNIFQERMQVKTRVPSGPATLKRDRNPFAIPRTSSGPLPFRRWVQVQLRRLSCLLRRDGDLIPFSMTLVRHGIICTELIRLLRPNLRRDTFYHQVCFFIYKLKLRGFDVKEAWATARNYP